MICLQCLSQRVCGGSRTEPEFRDVTRRLKRYPFAKRYLFRGQAAQQGFPLFSLRVVGKIYVVQSHKTTIKR